LAEDEATFLKVFVLSRGNLKAVGQELGISYPTVSSKLDEVIAALSGALEGERERAESSARQDILDRIASGDLSAAEGLKLMKELKSFEEGERE
jgi:hypothetical protein